MSARAAIIALALAGAARADLLSPGPLAKGHAELEGVTNCTQCHVRGGQLSGQRCLDCHKEIAQRVAQKKGFHGLLAPAQRTCNLCHREHQGRDVPLIDWPAGGQKAFDHKKTGFVLEGAHAKLDCAKCHLSRLVVEPGVKALIAQRPARATFLGLGTQCTSCHFDEHRAQLAGACTTCHTQVQWKPTPGFSHDKTAYPLLGKHAAVDCLKCHAKTLDADAHKEAPLPPRAEVFERFKPVAHGTCTDCHKDPHEGRLGADCTSCHTVAGWTEVKGPTGARAFHEKTRYPLRGAHLDVACRSCHGPFPGVAAVFKGMKFGACADCHVDAHLGQVGSPPLACDGCHSVAAFLPARYDPASHRKYPLDGSHAAVACSGCHKADASLAARASPLREWIAKRRRSDPISLVRFHPQGQSARCDTCHRDPHAGQFAARVQKAGCADCHQVASFSAVRFDHARDSQFPLTGAHAQTACAACHFADASGTVKYKPLATACAACHADPHAGQFTAAAGPRADCAACHATARWEQTAFVHKPPFTSFELDGKHAKLECAACHREVAAAGARVRQYRGVPQSCAGCHVDVHKGAFREVVQ